MASPTVDRRLGLVGNAALKAPVLVVATSNITLSGEQTIDGESVLAVNASSVADRVLCTAQTTASENGIYDVSTGTWSRSADANGPYDLMKGTTVFVTDGTTYGATYWQITSDGPITVGTTSVTWTTIVTALNASVAAAAASATLASQWATKTDGAVSGGEFSAKYYAQLATTAKTNAETAETNAETAEANAELAETNAEAAQAAAELARDAANAATLIFADPTAGLAAVANGEYFYVVSADNTETLELWWDNAGVATDTGKRFPAADAFKGVVETVGSTTVLTTAQQVNRNYVWCHAANTTKEGYLDTVSFRMSGITTEDCVVSIIVFELVSGSSYTIAHEWRVRVANGLNTFTAPDNFDPVYVPVDSLLGLYVRNPTTAAVQSPDFRVEVSVGNSKAFKASDMDGGTVTKFFLGNTVSLTADAVTQWFPLLSFTLSHFDQSFKDEYESGVQSLVEGKVPTKTEVAEAIRGRTCINRTSFPGVATPTGWTLGGGAVSDGLTFATPGNSAFAAYDTNSSANYAGAVAKFTVTDTAAQFGIGWDSQGTDYGGYVEIDGTNNKLRIMQWVSGVGSAPGDLNAYGRAVTIAALVNGRSYTLRTVRKGHNYEVSLIDSVTQTETILAPEPFASTLENFNGRAGFLHRAGSASGVKCTYFERYVLFDDPKIIVLGDSNAYGMSLDNNSMQNVPRDFVNAWPHLLDMARGRGDVLNASRPGETSTGLAGRLTIDLNLWSPDYVVIAMGTNDTLQATWRTQIAAVVAAVVARGATPVLCTFPPRAATQAFLTAANADIRDAYFGDYPYIDLAFALTDSNDSVTWNTSFDIGDGIHFNKAGHAAAYNQVRLDAPFLLLD
jgi:lysophospholipase L1-like esterase